MKIADNFRGGREIPEYFLWGKEKFGNFREKISAFWYAGADSLNVCSSDESSAMRLLIDVGSCLIMLGGWLEYLFVYSQSSLGFL